MKKLHHFFSIAFLFFALISKQSLAQTFPEKSLPPRLVNDFAKIYSAQQNDLLEEKLLAYEEKTSTQIAVVTITSLSGYPIDDYTVKLANKWQIGQKGKNNGLLLLIAKEDHKVYIASGYGMEGALNDGKLGTIIRYNIIPQFKKGDYYAGTNDGIDAMIAAADGEFVNDGKHNSPEKDVLFYAKVLMYLLFFFLIVFVGTFRSAGKSFIIANGIYYGSRGGGSGSDQGGFGGFGGGGFGGGGAGGSW